MKLSLPTTALMLLLTACTSHENAQQTKAMKPEPKQEKIATTSPSDMAAAAAHTATAGGPLRAVAQLMGTSGSSVTGMVTFVQQPNGVEVHVHIENLAPGRHGMHVHEHGDCASVDGSSAGGHFNPDNAPHGDRLSPQRHVGDLGNINADASGTAEMLFLDAQISLSGPHSILDRGLVVHADPDDGMSQPSGNSGARVACGAISEQH